MFRWWYDDLTAAIGSPPGVPGSALTSWADARYQHVIFMSAEQHVHEFYRPIG